MSGEIKFHFHKGGKTTMEVNGVKGEACTDVTRPFQEKMLGNITSQDPTDEMYEAVQDHDQEHEQQ
jgi:hypothetical protein